MFRCGWPWKVWLGVGSCEREWADVSGSAQVWVGVSRCEREWASVCGTVQVLSGVSK